MRKISEFIIKNETYELVTDYKAEDSLRQSLNLLTKQTYGFDFEVWYQQGFWGDRYRPYSVVHKDRIVANVSANPIDFLCSGKLWHMVQLGTVMTEEAYRHKGLSRALMECVLKEYELKCDGIYLYANDSVLDFYPKFGFIEAEEYSYSRLFHQQRNRYSVRKLSLADDCDKELLLRLVNNPIPFTRHAMVGNPGLLMFYLNSFNSDELYYIEELDLLAVVSYEKEEMLLTDVFCEHAFDLDEVINSLTDKPKIRVTLGFTPEDASAYEAEILKEPGTTFFIKGKNPIIKGRFPILSHA